MHRVKCILFKVYSPVNFDRHLNTITVKMGNISITPEFPCAPMQLILSPQPGTLATIDLLSILCILLTFNLGPKQSAAGDLRENLKVICSF